MNDDDQKNFWQGLKCAWQEHKPSNPSLTADEQMAAIRKKMAKMHPGLNRADLLGAVLYAAVTIPFIYYVFTIPYFVTRIGALIIIGGYLFASWKTIRRRQSTPLPIADAPVLEWLKYDLAKVRQHAEDSRTLMWWYLLPFLVGTLVFLWGMPVSASIKIGPSILMFVIAGFTYWLNGRVRRKQWLPMQKELESLLQGEPVGSAKVPPPASSGGTRFFVMAIILVFCLGLFAAGNWLAGSRAAPLHEPGFDDVSAFGDSDIARLDAWLQEQVALGQYPSLSVAIVRDGKIVYQRAFGFANIKAGKKATSQTSFHVASVTKAFTATLAVLLHERGVIDLDKPAVSYLPADVSISTKPALGATITLRQLASHTSGLPRGVSGAVQSVEGRYELEPKRLYDQLANISLEYNPGTGELYSNLGFGLLGHVLERAAGKPFEQLLQEMICVPLHLEGTAINDTGKLSVATGYGSGLLRGEEEHSYRERFAFSGGLIASAPDLAQFLAAQMKPGFLSSEMLTQLHTPAKLRDGRTAGTALGWSVGSSVSVGRILEKNGGRNNCSAWIGFAPGRGVGVAVVANSGGPDVDPIGLWLLERSVPGGHKPVTKDGYVKVAPYTGVRWENDRPIVCVKGKWSPLVSVNGLPVDRIMEFAQKEFDEKARMRFAEDLVEVLSKMGHDPEWTVTLGLEKGDGQIEQVQARLTEENRNLVRK